MSAENLKGQRLEIRYVKLLDAAQWDRNPKLHDISGIIRSIELHGFRDAPIFDGTLNAIVAGNGRATALAQMRSSGKSAPPGIMQDSDGEWWLPMQFGIDADTAMKAEAFGVDHNNLTLLGGDLKLVDLLRIWEEESFVGVVESADDAGVEFASLDEDDIRNILDPPFEPEQGAGEQPELDKVKTLTCPHCGVEFEQR